MEQFHSLTTMLWSHSLFRVAASLICIFSNILVVIKYSWPAVSWRLPIPIVQQGSPVPHTVEPGHYNYWYNLYKSEKRIRDQLISCWRIPKTGHRTRWNFYISNLLETVDSLTINRNLKHSDGHVESIQSLHHPTKFDGMIRTRSQPKHYSGPNNH